jgi:ankyrin repeat protein
MSKFIIYVYLLIFFDTSAHGMDNDVSLGNQLVAAAAAGNQEKVKRLLDAKAPIDYADTRYNWTVLIAAASKGRSECVRMLIDAQACVDYAANGDTTALMFAIGHGYSDCVRMLIAAGASLDQANNEGVSALMCAVDQNHHICSQVLIDAGASVGYVSNAGVTVMMTSIENNQQLKFVELMLRIPNKEQKKKISIFLGYLKKEGSLWEIFRQRNTLLKEPFLAGICELNRRNFRNSIAYREVAKLPDGPAKKALLAKFDRNEKTQSGCGVQ